MKKCILSTLFVGAVLVSSGALAVDTAICSGATTAGDGVTPASGTAGTNFMVRPIPLKCSANVWLQGTDGTGGAWYALGSASVKGRTSYKSNTNGGAVSAHTFCAVAGSCTSTDATTARTQANTEAAASSS